jgi:UDP-N-acetyl-D-galactosamine dehydrogenase
LKGIEMNRKISVVGLGYVGLPLAASMATRFPTLGFDVNARRIQHLKDGIDQNGEVPSDQLKNSQLRFTHHAPDLQSCDFHIVAVPTPVDSANVPDMSLVLSASEALGRHLKKGDVVVYESTVYPGATEEDCIPVLEKTSGLRAGVDFKVGYSPERINPGDREHTFTRIKKVVSGQDQESTEIIASVYGAVVEAGVHRAPSIRVAEAAKVIENTQRDLNIALMNELAILFHHLGIDTREVLDAAGTKWNFLNFSPGLVGGHCIGVDPYYLTYRAEKSGYIPQVILAGRRINDSMGRYIAQQCVKKMIQSGHSMSEARVTVLGLTFKENCPDIRNSKVVDIIRELQSYSIDVQVHDPLADETETRHEYGINLLPWDKLKPANAVILAVAHSEYRSLSTDKLLNLMGNRPMIMDVKSVLSPVELTKANVSFWRL